MTSKQTKTETYKNNKTKKTKDIQAEQSDKRINMRLYN